MHFFLHTYIYIYIYIYIYACVCITMCSLMVSCHVIVLSWHAWPPAASQSPRRRLVRIDGNVDVMQRHGDRCAPGGTNESKSEREMERKTNWGYTWIDL